MHLARSGNELLPKAGRPVFALVTLIPLVWLLSVTMTAGVHKIFNKDPRIGFLALAKKLDRELPALQQAETVADAASVEKARRAVRNNRILRFNQYLDAVVAGGFLVLVSFVVLLSIREWLLLIARKRLAELRETEPVWLPAYAIVEGKPLRVLGFFTLGFALLKELSGEAEIERARLAPSCVCAEHQAPPSDAKLYTETLDARYRTVRRCC